MSMYLLTPEEAAQEAFIHGDNHAYAKLTANIIAEKKEDGHALCDRDQTILTNAIECGWVETLAEVKA